ncbi:unnamed protein product [Adineta steineri]|uniref:Uncharacterized protein n=1 Tax=Adineta steineri TaxID=433720 RepID=A0A813X9X7_9BILA|nr:unnamed protein product [Adineta steineri]CAF0865201.1 unnamed protein product [Adineta steineri]
MILFPIQVFLSNQYSFFLLSKLKISPTDPQRRSISHIKKHDRHLLSRNQFFDEKLVNSFVLSSSTSAIRITRQDVPELLVPPKRYVSSFKTLVNSTNNKHTQRLNYINDSVMIFKLSKEQASNGSISNSQMSSKHSSLSTTNTNMSCKIPQSSSPIRLSPILKIEGQKRRIVHHDSPIIVPPTGDISIPSNQMTMSTSSHLQANSSVFTYRSTAANGNTLRQRTIVEPPSSNSLLITAERFKSNLSSTIRPTKQQSMATAYVSSQQTNRNLHQNARSRIHLEKLTHSRENYEYADPFTNCPQDLLNKLSHLTKLQLDTIEWEKKKRFTKKKTISNAFIQGKDSP